MKKSKVLKMDDMELDAKVKIEGTMFDRKRKFSDRDIKKMQKMLSKKEINEVAKHFKTSVRNIRYNCDKAFREAYIARLSGKHTGVDTCTFADRVNYKRSLVKRGKIKLATI